jgi:hypothetical protein
MFTTVEEISFSFVQTERCQDLHRNIRKAKLYRIRMYVT